MDLKSEGHESIGGGVRWQGEGGVKDELEANEILLVPEIPGIPWLNGLCPNKSQLSSLRPNEIHLSAFLF